MSKKLGTFNGVFVPSVEAILGAVLFLILPLLVGAVGVWNMMLIVILANTTTMATAFSIADSSTNANRVGAGGLYALSKHSLGIAFGGSIGIQLYIAQALSIGFYAVGFAEPLQQFVVQIEAVALLVEELGLSELQQKQILATLVGFVALLIALVGADFVNRLQTIIFVVLILAVGTVLASPFLGPTFQGQPIFTATPVSQGLIPSIGFWAAFAIFFPAVTGIDAGVGMSGKLQDPSRSLARGTFLAIGVTFLVYMATTYVFGLIQPALLTPSEGYTPSTVQIFSEQPAILAILLIGIFFATGSSALSYFITAPQTAQALVRDRVFPRVLGFMGRDFTATGKEPRWATVVTFLLFLPVIWAGDLSVASLIVGISFLVVYAWMNLAAFFERISGNPSFRPSSRGHWLVSLYGFCISIAVVALFDIRIGIAVVVAQLTLSILLLKYRAHNMLEGVWWGVLFSLVGWGSRRLGAIVQGTKNWRPIVGVFGFADREEETDHLRTMALRIGEYRGYVCVNLLCPRRTDPQTLNLPPDTRLIRTTEDRFGTSVRSIAQATVPGNFNFNTVILPLDTRFNLTDLIRDLISDHVNVLLYRHGQVEMGAGRIDVYWKGQENGNLMALLSYIITQQPAGHRGEPQTGLRTIRIIRKLTPQKDEENARLEMEALLSGARLSGEVLILPADDQKFSATVATHSRDAAMILMGMPGEKMGTMAQIFQLDELFFSKQIAAFDGLPPILFVKAAEIFNLYA